MENKYRKNYSGNKYEHKKKYFSFQYNISWKNYKELPKNRGNRKMLFDK